MYSFISETIVEFWGVLTEMAPYLLFGFAVAGVLSVLISTRMVEKHLGGHGFWPVFKSSMLGVPLPLCSCGVIPVAASLRQHGASRGATVAFLLSTPQTGVDSIAVTFSLLGPVIAVFRPIAALVTGILGGLFVDLLAKKDGPDRFDSANMNSMTQNDKQGSKLMNALRYGFVALPQDLGNALIVGLVIAGLISAAVPDDFFAGILGGGIVSMLVLMLVGIPVYVCATASVPIAAALIAKGISPGAALVFLITGPATNAAAITTIWRVLGKRTAFTYLGTIAVMALASGLLLDQIVGSSVRTHVAHHTHSMLPSWFGVASALLLIAVLINAVVIPRFRPKATAKSGASTPDATLAVGGMTCNHCAAAVEQALSGVVGVRSVSVDLGGKRAEVFGTNLDIPSLRKAVEDAGYKVIEKH